MQTATRQFPTVPMTDPCMDIQAWLESHGLDDIEEIFVQNDITPDLLPTLSLEDLREMGITSLGLRKKAMAGITALHTPAPKPASVSTAKKAPNPAPPVARIKESTPPSGLRSVAPAPAPAVALPVPAMPPLPVPALAAAPRPAPAAGSSPAKLAPQPAAVSSSPKRVKRKLFSGSFLVVSVGLHLVLGIGCWVLGGPADRCQAQAAILQRSSHVEPQQAGARTQGLFAETQNAAAG
jgi:hypothetical protein